MSPKEKAEKIRLILEDLYPEVPIPLDHKDAYTLLVAMILSAQCSDIRVNKITPALFEKADNPYDMVKLGAQKIKDIIHPCGLSSTKSQSIWKLSQVLINKYEGKIPNTLENLESLPGVGHKTSSAMMIHIFKKPAFPVDTHIHRLAKRWGLSNGKNVKKTEADLKKVFPKKLWSKLHLQIVYFGREQCPAKKHDPQKCPICSWASDQ